MSTDQFAFMSLPEWERRQYTAMQNAVYTANAADMVNAYSPERLSREQLKRLLGWNASPHVTDAMLVQAVYNRLHLRRLSMDEIAGA